MLPEFLFTVGNSMQDLPCDEFNLINDSSGITTNGGATTSIKSVGQEQHHQALTTFSASSVKFSNSNGNNNTTISSNSSATNANTLSTTTENFNNFEVGLLSGCGIKLENAQSNNLSTEVARTSTANGIWQPSNAIFNRCETTASTTLNSHPNSHLGLSQQHQKLHHLNQHQQHNYHHHQLLLQGSDDPLICHGANSVVTSDDDHSLEFKHLLNAASNGQQRQQQPKSMANTMQLVKKQPQNGCSSLTKQQLKVKAGLMSQQQQQQQQQQKQRQNALATQTTNYKPKTKAKKKSHSTANATSVATVGGGSGSGALKLRFHHQALPPEYLSHYEATQRQLGQNGSMRSLTSKDATTTVATSAITTPTTAVKHSQTAKLPPGKSSHENVRSWLQKIAEIQRNAQQQQQQRQHSVAPTRSRIGTEVTTIESTPVSVAAALPLPPHDANNNRQLSRMSSSLSPLLPASVYEHAPPKLVTLYPADQSQSPTIPVGQKAPPSSKRILNYADLPYMGEITLNNSKPRRGRKPKKADICHLIYKNYGTILLGTAKQVMPDSQRVEMSSVKVKPTQHFQKDSREEQPLNLCLRDYYQSSDLYSVSSGDGNCADGEDCDDDAATDSCETTNSDCDATPGDALTDTLLATNMETAMPSSEVLQYKSPLKTELNNEKSATTTSHPELLVHPARIYYQKLLESGVLVKQSDGSTSTFSGLPIETIEKDNQLALKIPIPSGLFLTPKLEPKTSPTPTPNEAPTTTINASVGLDYPEPLSTPSSIKSEQSFTTTNSSNITNATVLTGIIHPNAVTPQKRKRSAIFIPPMPAENAANPANEVSICKFKFTGGAKPTLQEKKMLSVDSDGNYRYYSGTGDKSMRGYEFFPRESLQQSGFVPGVSGANAFLNATGEKISLDIPPPSADLSNEILQIPDSPTATLLMSTTPIPASTVATSVLGGKREGSTTTSTLMTTLVGNGGTNQVPLNSSLSSSFSSSSTSIPLSPRLPKSKHNSTNERHIQHNMATTNSNSSSLSPLSQGSLLHQRKKKSSLVSRRTSSQREKLEKTFKEKGFLIQTQQLESAEGATYCKFRQLKKFTRYLFRNWKDYLPDDGQVPQQVSEAGQQAAIESFLAHHSFDDGHQLQLLQPELSTTETVSSSNADNQSQENDDRNSKMNLQLVE